MRKHKIISFFILMFFVFLQSCSEKTAIDEISDNLGSGGFLRLLKNEGGLSRNDMNSSITYLLEAQVPSGSTLREMRVTAGFNDIEPSPSGDGDTTYVTKPTKAVATVPAAGFNATSPNTHGFPVIEYTVTLQQLADAVDKTQDQIEYRDQMVLNFELVLTDGTVFDVNNSNLSIRTGSYFLSGFRYILSLNAQQTRLLGFTSSLNAGKGRLRPGERDSVYLRFSQEGLRTAPVGFKIIPTITESGAANGQITDLGTLSTMDEIVYGFSYTAGDYAGATPSNNLDTVSFMISDAAVYAADAPMASTTIRNVYIIDNLIDFDYTKSVDVRNDSIANVELTFNFEEALLVDNTADLILMVTCPDFDMRTDSIEIMPETESVTYSFVPKAGSSRLSATQFYDVTVDASGARDEARNEINKSIMLRIP